MNLIAIQEKNIFATSAVAGLVTSLLARLWSSACYVGGSWGRTGSWFIVAYREQWRGQKLWYFGTQKNPQANS